MSTVNLVLLAATVTIVVHIVTSILVARWQVKKVTVALANLADQVTTEVKHIAAPVLAMFGEKTNE
jgi:hypothetical protein